MDVPVADLPAWFIGLAAFVFGAAWGSFFNVCIYRWPRGMSVVSPPSHCTHCETPVRFRDNLPILGWLLLRGKTSCCGEPLSPRYAVVELLTALLALALAQRFAMHAPPGTTVLMATLVTGSYFVFVGGLIIATFVDLEFMEIPDEVSLPGAALGLATVALRDPDGIGDAALGAGGGFLVVQLVFVWSYEHLTGRRGMGEGDSKLLMMIGAFTGWQGAVFAVVAGSAQGLLLALFALVTGRDLGPDLSNDPRDEEEAERRDEDNDDDEDDDDPAAGDARHGDGEPEPAYVGHLKMPFGPMLALGALEYLFFGDRVITWWFDLMISAS